MISVLPLTLVCVRSDDFGSRDAEHSIYELRGSCWSLGPGQRRLLGPDPCCVTWFITSILVKYLSHQRFFLYTQGERWASLSLWQLTGKICHHAIHINSSGTVSDGLHLSCFTQPCVQPYFRPQPVLSGKSYLVINPSSYHTCDF